MVVQATHRRDAQVIVIGGGVIGAACAFRLAQAGRDVLLLNADGPETAASYGNAGHIATEQLFPLASKEVLRNSWRYLLDAESPLRLRPGYLLPLLPWLARFALAARERPYLRGVAALVALQHSALVDMTDLMGDAGVGHLLHRNGHLEVFETPAGGQSAHAQAERLMAYGVDSVHLSADAVRTQVPTINTNVQGAVQYLGSGHVDDPWAVCQGLRDALLRHGGQMRQGRAVRIEADTPEAATVVLEDGSQLQSSQVLVCAGAWSKPLAASLGYKVPLDTERGYHISVGGLPPVPRRGAAGRLGSGAFCAGQGGDRAAGGGHGAERYAAQTLSLPQPVASNERKVIMTSMSMGLRMTGTVEFGGLKLPPDPRRFELLKRQLQALVPGIDTTDMRTWMGFRPSLPDHLPVLGRAPRHNHVFFAFGHQHLGLTLAGVTAAVIAELLLTNTSPIDLKPYAVDRFGFA
nr:FAD-binding oxidoreductase [Rhodoferax sp.]